MTASLPRTLTDFNGPSRESGQQIVFQFCPVCGSSKWKTYVNPITGGWYCHAPEHSGGGKIDVGMPLTNRGNQILQRLAGSHGSRESGTWPEITLPPWEPLCSRALRYLCKRGINSDSAARLGIVEMQDRMRVIVPYYGKGGEIIYWTARSYSALEEGPKYLAASGRHPLYIRPSWHSAPCVVLAEGVFDAITIYQTTGLPAVALGGKALPRYLEQDLLMVAADRVVVLLDGDALAAAVKLKRRLVPRRNVTVVPLKDGQDPSSLGGELREILK